MSPLQSSTRIELTAGSRRSATSQGTAVAAWIVTGAAAVATATLIGLFARLSTF